MQAPAKQLVLDRPISPEKARAVARALLRLEHEPGAEPTERRLLLPRAASAPSLRALSAAVLRQFARARPGTSPHRLSEASLVLISASDSPRIRRAPHHCPSCVSALIDLNWSWDPNWAGETIFYGPRGDAVGCVGARPGRVVLLTGKARYRISVPRSSCTLPRMALCLTYSCAGDARR